MMKGQMQRFVERRSHLPLKHKLHLMAETLRNCSLRQGLYAFHEKNTKDQDRYCVYGALGHMAGIPNEELKNQPYVQVLERYGLTKQDRQILVPMDNTRWGINNQVRVEPLEKAIFLMNDYEYKTHEEIADWLDNLTYKVI